MGKTFDIDWDPPPVYYEDDKTQDLTKEQSQELREKAKEETIYYCTCWEPEKVENWALGKKFYVCKKCKKELKLEKE